MRIIVLGSAGMAGSMISHYLKVKGHEVTGFNRTLLPGYYDKIFDFNNEMHTELFKTWVDADKPDAIINCIGYLVKESEANPAQGVYLNSYLPHWLEVLTKDTNTKVIQLSTDCIFNGKAWWYREDALPTETNWYGRTKALGELNNNKDLTLRQSIIGPAPQKVNTGLFNWIYKAKGEVNGYIKSMWNGITTLELAHHIEKIIVKQPTLSGILHLIPSDNKITSKALLLEQIVKVFNLPVTVNGIEGVTEHKILDNTRTEEYNYYVADYMEQLLALKVYMDKHKLVIGEI